MKLPSIYDIALKRDDKEVYFQISRAFFKYKKN